jgi:hypothetical protein
MDQARAQRAIIVVGEGRGFVVNDGSDPLMPRLVITASHCLPFFPPCASNSYLPDNQELSQEANRYEALTGAAESLLIADAPETGPGWLLSLTGRWFRCTAEHSGGPLWLRHANEDIPPGMSGSPIVADDGSAVGVVCTGSDSHADAISGPQPRLAYNLPVWFWPTSARKAETNPDK